MRLRKTPILINIALVIGQAAWAQDGHSDKGFLEREGSCLPVNVGKKCIVLDLRHSIDTVGKKFVYRWILGDGNTKKGLLVEHCYQDYGIYSVILDVIDEKNNLMMKNEFSKTITLIPPIEYDIDTVYQGFRVKFEYDERHVPGYLIEDVSWKISNRFYHGKKLNYTFKNEGIHPIEMRMVGRVKDKKIRGCKLMKVFVE